MLRWSLAFLIVALVAGLLGLAGAQFMATKIAWILFIAFLILAAICFVIGRRIPPPV
ncbi:MAG: DUF1328 domain-containing protein [candidate division Zixibacteria bacterium]|nr:DUF1328 domain-containing protein [candidate division Zixibacteria bacterium]